MIAAAGELLGKGFRGFLGFLDSRASGYAMLGLIAACAAQFGLWRWEVSRTDAANRALGTCSATIERYESAMRQCITTVEDFALAARQNQERANKALMRAELAEDAIRMTRQQAKKDIEKVMKDAEELRATDTGECRRLTDPLPDDFLDWVFGSASSDH